MVYYTELVGLYYLHPVLWVEISNTPKSIILTNLFPNVMLGVYVNTHHSVTVPLLQII